MEAIKNYRVVGTDKKIVFIFFTKLLSIETIFLGIAGKINNSAQISFHSISQYAFLLLILGIKYYVNLKRLIIYSHSSLLF